VLRSDPLSRYLFHLPLRIGSPLQRHRFSRRTLFLPLFALCMVRSSRKRQVSKLRRMLTPPLWIFILSPPNHYDGFPSHKPARRGALRRHLSLLRSAEISPNGSVCLLRGPPPAPPLGPPEDFSGERYSPGSVHVARGCVFSPIAPLITGLKLLGPGRFFLALGKFHLKPA